MPAGPANFPMPIPGSVDLSMKTLGGCVGDLWRKHDRMVDVRGYPLFRQCHEQKGWTFGYQQTHNSLFVFSIRYWDIGAAVIKFDPNPMGFVQRRGSRYL